MINARRLDAELYKQHGAPVVGRWRFSRHTAGREDHP